MLKQKARLYRFKSKYSLFMSHLCVCLCGKQKGEKETHLSCFTPDIFSFNIVKSFSSPVIGFRRADDHINLLFSHSLSIFLSLLFVILFQISSFLSRRCGFSPRRDTCHIDQTIKNHKKIPRFQLIEISLHPGSLCGCTLFTFSHN